MKNQGRNTHFAKLFVPAIMSQSGAAASIDISTLPQKDWRVHSGPAPVAGVEVHSLSSQKIAGTDNLVIKTETGGRLSVTDGEAERFCADHLVSLGYTVKAPTI